MTNGTSAPSAVHGDTYPYAAYGGVPLQIAIPYLMSAPAYSDLPQYWSWYRDAVLAATPHKEDMWAGAISKVVTKFAAHSFTIKDSKDSQLRVKNSQQLLKQADGGAGWITFAEKIIQDLATTDNGVFIRIRRADDQAQTIKLKSAVMFAGLPQQTFDEAQVTNSSSGAKITGLYHLDSLRCMRTGNLTYPVRYQPLMGSPQLLRWDQVLMYADQPSPRAELMGVGFCAASRCYKTIAKLAAMEQMIYEFLTGTGANKLVFLNGINDPTLQGILKSGEKDAQAKGLIYYLGTILGAIPSDTPVTSVEVVLKQLAAGFIPKDERDNANLIYANNLGIALQNIQPLSGQAMGTGTQSIVLAEAAEGMGMLPAFLKWWEQTVSDRVLPATTELAFDNEHDVRDQKAKAEARQLRGSDRAARIGSGEISPAIARQLAADDGDLPQELLQDDVTPGGSIGDDEKMAAQTTTNPAALALIGTEPTAAPGAALASVGKSYDALYAEELRIARSLARWA
jgi:hypothetical protein